MSVMKLLLSFAKAAEALSNATPKIIWMKITLTDVGKRFNRDWIFRHIHYEFTNGHSYAIIGPNGSGKSTLLQVIAGAVAESEGKVSFRFAVSGLQFSDSRLSTDKSRLISPDLFYQHISIAAPYL